MADFTVSNLEFPNEESFNRWLSTQNKIIEWNISRVRIAPKSDQKIPEGACGETVKRGRPRSIEWTKNFTCSFGGTPRACSGRPPRRTITKPSRKVGCTAKINVQKKFSSDTIFVTFFNQHTGHKLDTSETWARSRMGLATRKWLEKAVCSGMEWKELKRMTRGEVERADFLGGENENLRDQIEVPELLRISNQDFNNFRRKFLTQSAQLHANCRQSSSKSAEMITQAGEVSTQNDARPESDDQIKASFLELVEFAESYASSSSVLDNEERGLLKAATVQLAKLKRLKESKYRSWSERQRR